MDWRERGWPERHETLGECTWMRVTWTLQNDDRLSLTMSNKMRALGECFEARPSQEFGGCPHSDAVGWWAEGKPTSLSTSNSVVLEAVGSLLRATKWAEFENLSIMERMTVFLEGTGWLVPKSRAVWDQGLWGWLVAKVSQRATGYCSSFLHRWNKQSLTSLQGSPPEAALNGWNGSTYLGVTGEFGQVLLLVSQYWWKIASSFVYLEPGHKRWGSYWSNRNRGSKASKWCCYLAVVMNKVMVVFLLLCIAGSLEGVEKVQASGYCIAKHRHRRWRSSWGEKLGSCLWCNKWGRSQLLHSSEDLVIDIFIDENGKVGVLINELIYLQQEKQSIFPSCHPTYTPLSVSGPGRN